MEYSEIEVGVDQGVAIVTLNRPTRLNAWTDQMEAELRHATAAADADSGVRAIVLTGAGRGFCAGADMDRLTSITEDSSQGETAGSDGETAGTAAGRYTWFTEIRKPIVAAINGPCVGLGLVMACFADIRFASTSAVFSTTFARRGLIAEHGLAWLLPRLVGHANALDLLLSARKIDAQEAVRIGLVNFVAEDGTLREAALSYAGDLAANVSPRAMAVIKRQVYQAWDQDLRAAVRYADAEMIASFSTADFQEGVAHFVERRPARFTGL